MVVRTAPSRAPSAGTDRIFHALADATRRDIVRRVMGEEQSVSALARRYPMSFAAVQKHVAVLHGAGLVTKRRCGREQLVAGDVRTVQEAHRVLDAFEATWRNRLDRFGQLLDGDAGTGAATDRERPTGADSPMTVTDVRKDLDARTMTFVSEFDAPVERAWQLWADPRQLERWWGPPTYPATVESHDLRPGGTVRYSMTGPEGDRHGGWWRVTAVEAPSRLSFEDGFADAAGEPDPDMPVTGCDVTLEERAGGGTRMIIVSTFPSVEVLEQMAEMGMEEGLRSALGQIEDVLAT